VCVCVGWDARDGMNHYSYIACRVLQKLVLLTTTSYHYDACGNTGTDMLDPSPLDGRQAKSKQVSKSFHAYHGPIR
jgi:hypothetical protein